MEDRIKWHTAPELPEIGEKCLLIYDGELDDSVWECQENDPKSPYNPWITYTEDDHYTANYPIVSAWISLRELEELYHKQTKKDNGNY